MVHKSRARIHRKINPTCADVIPSRSLDMKCWVHSDWPRCGRMSDIYALVSTCFCGGERQKGAQRSSVWIGRDAMYVESASAFQSCRLWLREAWRTLPLRTENHLYGWPDLERDPVAFFPQAQGQQRDCQSGLCRGWGGRHDGGKHAGGVRRAVGASPVGGSIWARPPGMLREGGDQHFGFTLRDAT